jgi:hypothetical protein
MSGLFEKAMAMANSEKTPAAADPPGDPAAEAPEELLPVESGVPAVAAPAAPPAVVSGTDIVFDEDSGISKEDQKDILQEIEKAASEHQLAAGPQAFELHAQHKGVMMPLLVNLLAVALLAVGGLVLYYFFQRGESTLKEEALSITTAEGKLIEQLKKEAEEKLLEKNREISQIQGQLSEIDQQRRDLAANMDAKVAAREQELRQGMEAALEQEREKLRRQGVSEEDITRRIAALESQKSSEYQAQLNAFKRQAEEERLATENNLKTMQQEFQASLSKANEERQKVLEDSRQREAELTSQLQARTQALEAESRQARQDLARLSEQREKEQLAATQLIGFYSRVKGDLQAGSLNQALASLDGIQQYLNDPAIAALPNIQQRREVEFFVVDSLSSLIRGEMRKSSVDTTSLVAAANLLTELRKRIQEGDGMLSRGETAAAEKEYSEALALVPEVQKTHRWFLARQERQLAEALEAAAAAKAAAAAGSEEAARREALRQALAAARSAFEARDYSGTVERYAAALSYLPEDAESIQRLVSQLRAAGHELALESERRQESAAAGAPLAEADRLYAQGRYLPAISAYGNVLDRYPASTQARSALQGIGRAVEALSRRAEAEQTDTQGRSRQVEQRAAEVEKLRTELAKAEQELSDSRASLSRVEQDLKDRVALSEGLQREKQMLSEEVASLKAELAAARTATGEAEARAEAALNDQALKQKLARLEAIEGNYNRILASYREYAASEDSLVSARGDAGLVEAKQHLNSFLISTAESFPGFWTRIKRYDAAFEKDGRTGALEDVNDLLYELSLRPDLEERQAFLDAEARRRQGDALMSKLIKDLKSLQGASAGGLREANAILGEAALRKKPEARQEYLSGEMVKNRSNAELSQFLERLLALLRPAP